MNGATIATTSVGAMEQEHNSRPQIVFCGSGKHDKHVLHALQNDFNVVHHDGISGLARTCCVCKPLAIVVALSCWWEGESKPQVNTEVFHFVDEMMNSSVHPPIIIYTPPNQLTRGTYCYLAARGVYIIEETAPRFTKTLVDYVHNTVCTLQKRIVENKALEELFQKHGFITRSPALHDVLRQVHRASQSDAPVLITGETGTGKQLLAEAIHTLDPHHSGKPLLTVNCAAISLALAESELFGYEGGAFTGAVKIGRLGWFRSANRGTIILDEIGDLDPKLQPKLLRIIENHRVLPVGCDEEVPVSVRVIAVTNCSVDEKTLRADLYYRLCAERIHIPPLRERPEDIEPQALYFFEGHPDNKEKDVRCFDSRTFEALRKLPWKGNSRELKNCVGHMVRTKEHGDMMKIGDLPQWVLKELARPP